MAGLSQQEPRRWSSIRCPFTSIANSKIGGSSECYIICRIL
jgi:hypothetical protein